MRRLATVVGCTEGQAYTLVISAVLALALTLTGLPPALRGSPAPATEVAAAPRHPIAGYTDDDALSTATTTTLPPLPVPASRLPAAPGLEASSFGAGPPSPSPSSSSSATTTTTTTTPTTTTMPAGPDGLTIALGAYARAVGGGAGTAAVPAGGLPVGARAGQEDARVYLRLGGRGSRLRIALHPDGSVLAANASIAACRVTEADWTVENGSSLADAPPIDARSCVAGAAGTDGAWTFALDSFGDVTDARGIALVAVLAPGSTFQVTFRP